MKKHKKLSKLTNKKQVSQALKRNSAGNVRKVNTHTNAKNSKPNKNRKQKSMQKTLFLLIVIVFIGGGIILYYSIRNVQTQNLDPTTADSINEQHNKDNQMNRSDNSVDADNDTDQPENDNGLSQTYNNKSADNITIPQNANYIDYLGLNLGTIQVVYFDDKALLRIPNAPEKEYLLTIDATDAKKSTKSKTDKQITRYMVIKPHQTITLIKEGDRVSVLFNGDTVLRGIDSGKTKLNEFVSKANDFIKNSDWFKNNYHDLILKSIKINNSCKNECYLFSYEYLVPIEKNNSQSVEKYRVILFVNDKKIKVYRKPKLID